MTGALDGIRIVDLTTVILGPWATQMLGDMGADVIKVETLAGDIARQLGPRRNDGMAALYLSANRNKRSLTLDLNQRAGRDALFAVIRTADVFVHNMRPKVSSRLGLGYEHFAQHLPELIYCATYGFRRDGPMADKPAYDDVIQAASGVADLQGAISDQPRFVPTVIADKTTAYNVVSAILAGLFRRERVGVASRSKCRCSKAWWTSSWSNTSTEPASSRRSTAWATPESRCGASTGDGGQHQGNAAAERAIERYRLLEEDRASHRRIAATV